jgi:hypothetical protein
MLKVNTTSKMTLGFRNSGIYFVLTWSSFDYVKFICCKIHDTLNTMGVMKSFPNIASCFLILKYLKEIIFYYSFTISLYFG